MRKSPLRKALLEHYAEEVDRINGNRDCDNDDDGAAAQRGYVARQLLRAERVLEQAIFSETKQRRAEKRVGRGRALEDAPPKALGDEAAAREETPPRQDEKRLREDESFREFVRFFESFREFSEVFESF